MATEKKVGDPCAEKEELQQQQQQPNDDEAEDSVDSDEEENDSQEMKELLRKKVIDAFSQLSPETLLKLREELKALQENRNYDQVTALVPHTAEMMEQVFCREPPY